MVKIAILDDYADVSQKMADWSQLPGEFQPVVFIDNLVEHDPLVERLMNFEIICAMRERTPFPAELVERLPNLKLFITSGMRNKAVAFDALRAQGVVCCGTESPGTTTFEHTWALILAAARGISHDDRMMKEGKWQTQIGVDLKGKTLGVLGLGKLGGFVSQVAPLFGMKVIAWSENLTQERCDEMNVEKVSKEELLKRSDILTIHTILSDRTRGLIGAEDLALMKSSAILINTSRGPIVDEEALLKVLQDRKIRGAAIDVFSQEPLPSNHPIRSLDNVLLTPHMGYVTEETYKLFYRQMVENILAWHKGEPVREILA